MKTKVIKIGNSRGIRIPRHMLEQSGLKNEVELEVKDNKIIVKPITKLRAGWEDDFKRMSQNKDDVLLDKEYLENQSTWDNEEWEW